MSFTRQESSKSRLNIDWGNASPMLDDQAVDAAAVIRSITKGDGKPLMILRRATEVDKTMKRLLNGALESERFQLASKWFQCIQVDDAVLEEDNEYHVLFEQRRPTTLILASPDGKKIVNFLGTKSKKVNWRDINGVLKASYKGDPTKAVKGLEKLLSKFDALDDRRKELNSQLERCAKKKDAKKIKSLQAKLAKQERDREDIIEQEKRLRELVLRAKKKAEKVGG